MGPLMGSVDMAEMERMERIEEQERAMVEKISAAVHEKWMEMKRANGVTSRLSERGEELMRPYPELSETAKDLDRGTVRAVLGALPPAGYVAVPGGVAQGYSDAVATAGQTFGWAIKQMQNGACVQRAGWNGKGMHIYREDGFAQTVDVGAFAGSTRTYEPCIVMFTAQGKHQPGWLASQADMLAADWSIVTPA